MEPLGLPSEDERTLMVFPSLTSGLARTLVYKDLARSPLPG